MRHTFLVRSVDRLLDPGEELHEVALLSSRHRLMLPYTLVVFTGFVALAAVGGVELWATRVALGSAAAIIAVTATTDFRVLAATSRGLVLLRAGRIRQVARQVLERPGPELGMERVGGTFAGGEWRVGDRQVSVSRRHQPAMERIAGTRGR